MLETTLKNAVSCKFTSLSLRLKNCFAQIVVAWVGNAIVNQQMAMRRKREMRNSLRILVSSKDVYSCEQKRDSI